LSIENWSIDHFHPSSKGGEDTEENCVAACRECNLLKRDVEFDSIQDVRNFLKVEFLGCEGIPFEVPKKKVSGKLSTAGECRKKRKYRSSHRKSYNDYMKNYMRRKRSCNISFPQ